MSRWRRLTDGAGRFDTALREALRAEGVLFWAEDLRGEVSYHRADRAPGQRPGGKRVASAAAAAVTRRRLVVWVLGGKHVDLPVGQPWPAGVGVRVDRPGRVLVGYEAGAFRPSRSGWVEVRLWTDRADDMVAVLGRPGAVDSAWGDLVADGIRYVERGCAATVIRRENPDGPGTARQVTADVAVSEGRFVVWVGGGKFIDLPRTGGRAEGATARLVGPDRVELRLLARQLEPGVGRHITVTITTPTAAELVELLAGGPLVR